MNNTMLILFGANAPAVLELWGKMPQRARLELCGPMAAEAIENSLEGTEALQATDKFWRAVKAHGLI